MISIMALGGCGQKEAADTATDKLEKAAYDYDTVISEMSEEQAYAYIDIEEGLPPILLIAEGTYEYEEGVDAAISCGVYYVWDEKAEKLLHLSSDGTGYPIAADETAIYRAGLHYIEKYVMNFETNELELVASATEIFDTEGNVTHEGFTKGEMKTDGAAFLEQLREEYRAASVVNFTKSK